MEPLDILDSPEEVIYATGCHHFVDAQGKYLGSFVGAEPPEGSTEVPSHPLVDGQTWDGRQWVGMDAQIQKSAIGAQINALEAAITERRLREAILGADEGWLKAQNDKIAGLRARLP